jgi:hypothetical protein
VDVTHQANPHATGPDGREHVGNIRIQGVARRVEVQTIKGFSELAVEARPPE